MVPLLQSLPAGAGRGEQGRSSLRQRIRPSRFPWLAAGVICVNVAVYAFTSRKGAIDLDAMVRYGGKVAPLIIDVGEYWRLLTANFLHRDALHLALNMFVLFNVGLALENAYRRLDVLMLLLASGLATMGVSLLLTDAVSVGASGMVYGCLGGLVVFALKYRALLPSRYRRVLGEAVIPTVLLFLWIGWTSSGVDNSAHLGGLVCGIALGAVLRPKLLLEQVRPRRWIAPALAIAALLLAPFAAVPAFRELTSFRAERDDGFGISVALPSGWRRGANRLGQLAYYNGLPGLGRATFAAQAIVLDESFELAEQAQKFIRQDLERQTRGPDVMRIDVSKPVPARIADRRAVRVEASFEEPSGVTRLVAYFVRRGELVYQLVFTHPSAFPRYAAVVDRMVQALRLDEPRRLREARARGLLFPGAPWALAALGTTLGELGEPQAAVDALRLAVGAQPSSSSFRAQLALALLKAGELEQACAASAVATDQSPDEPLPLEAAARCELARGHSRQALERLRAARALAPSDERLRTAEEALRTAVEGAEK